MTKNNVVNVLIEIPLGSANKYEYNFTKKRIVLDRVLYGANFYPGEYGCIENTLDWDGDPLDVIALATYPTIPGCEVPVRILGALKMIDNGDVDTKLFGVFDNDPNFNHMQTLDDVPQHIKDKITNFFQQYKQLQKKPVSIGGWKDKDWALEELKHCYELYEKYNDILINQGKDVLLETFRKINNK